MKSRTLQLSNVPEQDGWGIVLSLLMHGLLLLGIVLYHQFFVSSRQIFTPNYQSVSLVGSAPTAQTPSKPAPKPELAPTPPPKPAPKPELAPTPPPKPAPKPEPAPAPPPKPAPKPEPAPAPPPKPTPPPKPAAEPIASKPQPTPEAAKPAPKPEAPAPKPEAKPRPDSSREIEQSLQALQREQEQRRVREAEATRQQQQALDNAISRLEQQALANSGAPGRAGGTPSQIDPRLQAYNQQLHDLIHRNWVVPDGINTRGLVVVINFNIRSDGQAERIWIEQSSGNPVYDQSGLRAAEKAAPFPPPPSIIRSPLYEVGIRFTYDG